MAQGIIYAGVTSAVIEWDGVRRPIGPDTTVREGHPILEAHPELFAPLVPHFEVDEPAKDEPPEDTAPPAGGGSKPGGQTLAGAAAAGTKGRASGKAS
jgi:hypothetical protein